MAGADRLDPLLRWAVDQGLITEAQALDVDAMADGLASRVVEGELSVTEAGELAGKQGISDAIARKRGRG